MTAARSPSGTSCVLWKMSSVVKCKRHGVHRLGRAAPRTARGFAWKTRVTTPYAVGADAHVVEAPL